MNKISMNLIRTVFLPVGSPPIGNVNEIKADIGKSDIHVEAEQLYCLGEIDIIIDYISFSPDKGRHLFPDQSDTYPQGQGKEWQAMINLPFSLNETVNGLQPCAEYGAHIGKIKWFMVAPRALEMEMEIIVAESDAMATFASINDQKKDGGWRMVSISDMENERIEQQEESIITFAEDGLTDTVNDMEIAASNEKPSMPDVVSAIREDIAESESSSAQVVTAAQKNELEVEHAVEAMADMDSVLVAHDNMMKSAASNTEDKTTPEIVRIVFNDAKQPDDSEIQKAIAAAKKEAANTENFEKQPQHEAQEIVASNNDTEATSPNTDAVAVIAGDNDQQGVTEKPVRKIRRSHGLPKLSVEAQNNNVEISAFNINIKLP